MVATIIQNRRGSGGLEAGRCVQGQEGVSFSSSTRSLQSMGIYVDFVVCTEGLEALGSFHLPIHLSPENNNGC
jgi:hypothetical protein